MLVTSPTITITVGGQTFKLPNPEAQTQPDPHLVLQLAIVRELANLGNAIRAHCIAIDHLAASTIATDPVIENVLLEIRANAAGVLAQIKGQEPEEPEPGDAEAIAQGRRDFERGDSFTTEELQQLLDEDSEVQ